MRKDAVMKIMKVLPTSRARIRFFAQFKSLIVLRNVCSIDKIISFWPAKVALRLKPVVGPMPIGDAGPEMFCDIL